MFKLKILGLSCSARKNGNTVNALRVALNHLESKNIETNLIHLTDYDIRPCKNCNMECYHNKDCPTPDESKKLADLLEEFDALIVGSPLYNGTIPALLSAFLERNPYPYDEVLKSKITSAIIVGSIGEAQAALILTSWLAPGKHFVGWIELDPRSTAARNTRLKDSWLEGNMLEDEQNRKRVKELADRVHSKMVEQKMANVEQ